MSPSPPFSLRGICPAPAPEKKHPFLCEILVFLQDLLYESIVSATRILGQNVTQNGGPQFVSAVPQQSESCARFSVFHTVFDVKFGWNFSLAHPARKISPKISRHLWQRKTDKIFTSALLQGSCSEFSAQKTLSSLIKEIDLILLN